MISISRLFKRSRGYQAEVHLAQAYKRFVNGEASKEDAQLILIDQATYAGIHQAVPKTTPDEELRYVEGMRNQFFRWQRFLELTPEEMLALERAASREGKEDAEAIAEGQQTGRGPRF